MPCPACFFYVFVRVFFCVCLQALASVEIRAPRVPVYSNVTAAPFPSDPEQIRELLARQLVEPVQVRGALKGPVSKGLIPLGACKSWIG